MRVLMVFNRNELTGGMEKYFLQLCSLLHRRGIHTEAVLPSDGSLAALLGEAGVNSHFILCRNALDFKASRVLAALAAELSVDVIHSHSFIVTMVSRIATRYAKNKVCIATRHIQRSLEHFKPRNEGFFGALKTRHILPLLDNVSARWCSDAVVAVSNTVREDLISQGYPAGLIQVIRNGIDPEPYDRVTDEEGALTRTELGVSDDEVLFLSVARLTAQKDIGLFIHAFSQAVKQRKKLKAVIAGTGPEEDALFSLIRELGLEKQVGLLGHRNDVPRLLAAADVFVLSSRWEGLPLSVLEAMASSLPVVATNVGGTREAVDDGCTGLLVPIGDETALAEALLEVASDKSLRDGFALAGRERFLNHFHVNRVIEQHIALYEQTLSRKF